MRFSLFRGAAALLAATLALGQGPVAADDAALILGNGPGSTLELSLADLAAMPQATLVTETDFYDGMVTFRGPLMRDVLARLELDKAETVRVMAANDFFADIPTTDFQSYDVILATEADGEPLSRRTKGPLWLMYPISDHAELRDPLYHSRLVWQVVRVDPL